MTDQLVTKKQGIYWVKTGQYIIMYAKELDAVLA